MKSKLKQILRKASSLTLSALMLASLMPEQAFVSASAEENKVTLEGNETDGYYYNMPVVDEQTLILPDNFAGSTFKLYDNGGADGDYSNNCRSLVTIVAPEGSVLMVTNGSMKTESGDYRDNLYAYDGAGQTDPLIFRASGEHSNLEVEFADIISTGNQMTFYFYTDSSVEKSGFDLTIKVLTAEELSTEYNITCNETENGLITASYKKAKFNTTVTITPEPSEGYAFQSLKVLRADGKAVPVINKNWFYDRKKSGKDITFQMPYCDVEIAAIFVPIEKQYINLSTVTNFTAVIPDYVKKFKIYDDGGENGNFLTGKTTNSTHNSFSCINV